ncbi:MAG: hypothetical protein ABI477_07045 [Chryseolinea sp.]
MTMRLLVVLGLLCIYDLATCQENLLMLQKSRRHKNAYYEAGNVISFRIAGERDKTTSEIVRLGDSTIVFNGFSIRVNKISHLYIDEKTKWWLRFKIEELSLIGGAGFILLDVLNTGEVSKETAIIGGAIIGVGIIAKLLIGNKIKIRGRTRLRIVNLAPPANAINH